MQNNIGLQTAYWNGTTPELDIYKIIDLTKKANMDTIELKAGDFVPLTTEERRKLKNYIKDAGLSVTVNGTGLRPEKDVSSSDKESHEAGIKHLCHMLDLCVEMDAKLFPEFLMVYGIHARMERILPGSRRSAQQMQSKD